MDIQKETSSLGKIARSYIAGKIKLVKTDDYLNTMTFEFNKNGNNKAKKSSKSIV